MTRDPSIREIHPIPTALMIEHLERQARAAFMEACCNPSPESESRLEKAWRALAEAFCPADLDTVMRAYEAGRRGRQTPAAYRMDRSA